MASELVMFVLAALVYVCASRSLAVPVKKSGHVKSMGGLLDLCVFFVETNMVVGWTFM